jgi:hypothetical protein
MSSQLNSAAITLTKEMPMEKAYGGNATDTTVLTLNVFTLKSALFNSLVTSQELKDT